MGNSCGFIVLNLTNVYLNIGIQDATTGARSHEISQINPGAGCHITMQKCGYIEYYLNWIHLDDPIGQAGSNESHFIFNKLLFVII